MKQWLGIAVFLIAVNSVRAFEITDMANRKVVIEGERLEKIFTSAPSMSYLITIFDFGTNALVGLNSEAKNPTNDGSSYILGDDFGKQPVLGGWFDNGPQIAPVKLKEMGVQAVFVRKSDPQREKVLIELEEAAIPVIIVDDSMEALPETFRFMGRLTGRTKKGEAMADWAETALKSLNALRAKTADKPLKVFYAGGVEGFFARCPVPSHDGIFRVLGVENPPECVQAPERGITPVSFESLQQWDPDVIITQNGELPEMAQNDPLWKSLRAVRNQKFWVVPKTPFNWLDQPSSFMELLGALWLGDKLYPRQADYNMADEAQGFFWLAFGTKLRGDAPAKMVSGR